MHCCRDATSLHQLLAKLPSSELTRLIQDQLEVLAAFDDVPLSNLAHFFILEPGDSDITLASALGQNLSDMPIETCLNHYGWFELIIIVSDSGFGYVVFIPKNIEDESLMNLCISQVSRTQKGAS